MDKYDSIKTLPLYNWDQMIESDDYNWLIIGYDGRQKKQESQELQALKNYFINQYIEIVDDGTYLSRLRLMARINKLEVQKLRLSVLIDIFWRGFSVFSQDLRLKYIKEINSIGAFDMPEINTLQGDFEAIQRVIAGRDGIDTTISLLKKELKHEPKKERSLFLRLRELEKVLDYNIKLNPKEMTLKDYIDLILESRNNGKSN